MSKINGVPFISKVIASLSETLKNNLIELIDGSEQTPSFRSLINNNDYITNADKNKVQYITLETKNQLFTGYLIYNNTYCVLLSFVINSQSINQLKIDVDTRTYELINEPLSIFELREELVAVQSDTEIVEVVQDALDADTLKVKKLYAPNQPIGRVLQSNGSGGTQWAEPREVETSEHVVTFDNVAFTDNEATLTLSSGDARWTYMQDTTVDCVLVLRMTDNTSIEMRRINYDSTYVEFGATLNQEVDGNGKYMTIIYSAKFASTGGKAVYTELEANKGNIDGDAPYLSDLTIGNETYKVVDNEDVSLINQSLSRHELRIKDVERAVGLLEEEELDFDEILDLVDDGVASDYFYVGDTFDIQWTNGGTTYHIDHDVVDHSDAVVLENGVETTKHAMTLQWHYAIDGIVFDAPEFMAKTASQMPIGTYHFTVANDSWGGNDGKTYQFTTDQIIPLGYFLRPNNAYNATMEGAKLQVFANATDTTATMEFALTEGSGGTDLGTMGSTSAVGSSATYLESCSEKGGMYLNDYQCVVLGDNNYYYSYVRQYLNATTTGFYQQQHIFDRPPSNYSTAVGFLANYDSNFVNKIKATKRTIVGNTRVYGNATISFYDKIFIPTMAESNVDGFSGLQNTGGVEGNAWEYYQNLADGQSNINANGTFKAWSTYEILKKYNYLNKSSAIYQWKSSAFLVYACGVLYVYASGRLDGRIANDGLAVSPAFKLVK